MSINLIDMFKDQVSGTLVNQATSMLGESKSGVESALGGIVPSLLGSLVDKGSSESGATSLLNMINNEGFDGGMLNNVAGLLGGGGDSILTKGNGILNMLMGNKQSGLIDMISNFAGIKRSSSGSLLAMAAPFLMSLVGKQAKSQGLNASGLMSMLGGQSDFIKAALPSGMKGVGNLLGFSGALSGLGGAMDSIKGAASGAAATVGNTASATANRVGDAASATAKAGKSGLSRILPLALLAIAALAIWYFVMGPGKAKTAAAVDAVENVAENAGDAAANAANAAGDAVKNAAEATGDAISSTVQAARDGLKNLAFEAGSAGDKLYNFLSSGKDDFSREVFSLKNMNFATGSAELTEEMKSEVNNLAEVLKAYPGVTAEVAGHTDNTGDAANNRYLSQKRADAIKGQLIAQGVEAERLMAKGYGPDQPVADNSTEEGRKQNRRVDIVITGK